MGNPELQQSMFLISETVNPKTLFARCTPSFVLPAYAPTKKSPVKKSPKVQFTLVQLDDSQEIAKKETYTNENEANAVSDLLQAYKFDLASTAVLTPYRTQALVIKNSVAD